MYDPISRTELRKRVVEQVLSSPACNKILLELIQCGINVLERGKDLFSSLPGPNTAHAP